MYLSVEEAIHHLVVLGILHFLLSTGNFTQQMKRLYQN